MVQVIDGEPHRDQIKGFCPPLVELPRKSKQLPPSELLSPEERIAN